VGFGSVNTLRPVVCAWRSILETIKPDLVVSDYSPILCLAAFGQVPVLTIGDGFVQPPGAADRYPRLRPGETGLPDESAMLAVVREVQAKLGRPLPPSLPRITQGDGQILTVLEELDVYAQCRRGELRAPFGVRPIALGAPDKRSPSYFIYLTALAPATRKVLQALLDLRLPFEAFLRDADRNLKDTIRRCGGFVYDEPPELELMLRRHHAIIHHGGIGTSQAALAMGRPQVVIPRHFEQSLTAVKLKSLSVAAGVGAPHRLADIRAVLTHLPRSRMPEEAIRRAKNIEGRNYPDLHRVIVAEASRLVSS
jgi:rhamnosyltransferase subunit B